MASYAYLGPAGTFTHEALQTILTEGDTIVPHPSMTTALDAVRDGDVDAAFVPIENSVEGGVSATLDYLANGDELMIRGEVLLPVQFTLFARTGTTLADVRAVISHPHALAQVRGWLAENLTHAAVVEGGSTAAAAAEVANPESRFDAAISSRIAGEMHGLQALARDIADNTSAVTRFVVVTRPGRPPAPTGADKTTLVAYMKVDRSGALLEILEQFASRGVNLTRIESRPTKTQMGNYCFSIDAEGHVTDARMLETLMGLRRICGRVVFLGSYPRADRVRPLVAEGFTDHDFTEAYEWVQGLINRPDED